MQAIPASPSSPASEVARSICGRGLKGNRLQETVSVPITGKFNGGVGFRPGWIQGPRWYYQGSGCPVASHFLGPRPAFVQWPQPPPCFPVHREASLRPGWLAGRGLWVVGEVSGMGTREGIFPKEALGGGSEGVAQKGDVGVGQVKPGYPSYFIQSPASKVSPSVGREALGQGR